MAEDLDPSLRNIVEQDTLNWIFVGGKGIQYLLISMMMDSYF